MDKPGHDEPAGVIVGADGFRGLKQVLELRELGIGITSVDQPIEELNRLPDVHLVVVKLQVFATFAPNEVDCLVVVI